MQQIRNTLKSKWAEYLIEVLAITAGILFAFGLDNWNSSRLNRALEREILEQIAEDLEENLNDLRSDLEFHRICLESNLRVQNIIDADTTFHPEMAFDFYYIQAEEYSYALKSGYERLKLIGVETSIPDSLRARIETVYEEVFPRVSKGSSFHPDINEYFRSYYQRNFKINENPDLAHDLILQGDTISYPAIGEMNSIDFMVTIGYIPKDFEELKKDPVKRQSFDCMY